MNNKKIDCLICEKQYWGESEGIRVKTFVDTRILPLAFINSEYENVNNFIKNETGRIFEADNYKIEKSADYDYNKYKKYIDAENNKILKAIEYINNCNNVINKNETLKYLNSLI